MSILQPPATTGSETTNSQSYLDTKLNTILQPKTAEGISGFIFDIPDTETLRLQSDITDHFTENNSFINDHIVRKPVMITLTGFIGEQVFRPPAGFPGAAQEISNRLSTVPAYLGDLTPGAVQVAQETVQKAQSVMSGINQAIDRVQNLVEAFDGLGSEDTLQKKAYRTLFALWKSADLVTVQTPWNYYDNMVIQSISFRQDGDSKFISDISVTLKEFRVAEVRTVNYDDNQFPPREEIQSGEVEDQGIIRGEDVDSSFLFQAFGD